MNKKQYIFIVMVVIVSSFFGSLAYQYFAVGCNLFAKDKKYQEQLYSKVVRTKSIQLVSDDGKIHATFYLGTNDAPNLVLFDKNEKNRFNFGLAPAGNAGLTIYSEDGKKIWSAP
jgi:hypothetical protein